jgi:hypothetical protein
MTTIASVLVNRRWMWRIDPFRHVVAQDVFEPDSYQYLEAAFKTLFRAGDQMCRRRIAFRAI